MKIPDRRSAALLAILLSPFSAGLAAGNDCIDSQTALERWRPIREGITEPGGNANELALELVPCLGSPDPELRDRIGYELFAFWLRQEQLSDATRALLLDDLSARLAERAQEQTLSRSFSALVLGEIMRSDALRPFMNERQQQALLDAATTALKNENDYRGLDAEIGWVHPVAHMSDLLWRFALHPDTGPEQAKQILEALRSKTAPTAAFYNFNEGDRLARIVTTLVTRKTIDSTFLIAWINRFEKPSSMERWSDAFRSPGGMAELHNTKQFLRALSDQLDGANVEPEITEALNQLVQGFTQLL
jgi:hypothetical protein